MHALVCSICGGSMFRERSVLWPELVAEWQLSDQERCYIDRQQGCACSACGASLRIVALGNAIRAFMGTGLSLRSAVRSGIADRFRILDCNSAAVISDTLAVLPAYTRRDCPEYDLRRLPFPDASFDLVLHSDTLEHIEHPVVALQECRRVLALNARLCFTVPIIHGRLTRSRAGLAPSYHGDPSTSRDDYIVHTEFGADFWTIVNQAGFTSQTLHAVDFPSAMAISAWTEVAMTCSVTEPASLAGDADVRDQDTINHASAPYVEVTPLSEQALAPQDEGGPSPIYDQDGLRSVHNHEFMHTPVFKAAYARGVQAVGTDYNWHWRVHTGLWAATMAARLSGDFAEFGVNRGFLSSAIMQMLDWDSTGRCFYLLDTFTGIDERYINEDDLNVGVIERNQRDIESGFYTFDLDAVRANFAEWANVCVVPGPVPETLAQITSERFAFAHIDMNCAPPEVAAAEFLWPRLVPGALMLLDDYAYSGYRSQKLAMDEFACRKGVPILSLPTGQGLIIKPSLLS